MIRTNGSVVLPVVIWAPTPPAHEITSFVCSDDGKKVVTGAFDGNLLLWNFELGNTFTPRWMLCGHRCAVRNLCWASSCDDHNSYFVSHSESSELALWNWSDGKCLEFKIDSRHDHVTIKSHQPAFLDHRLLFCCGRYPHIVVIHAMSLSVLFNLASQSQPDWISAFTVFTHPNKRHEVVLGLSFSGVAILWTLNSEEVQGEVKYEHESKMIGCPSTILTVHCCPQLPRFVLLVSHFCWQLLDAVTCSIVFSQPHPKKDPLVAGEFVDGNTVAIYCHSGVALFYRFTSRQPSGSIFSSCEEPILLTRIEPNDSGCSVSPIAHERRCYYSIIRPTDATPSLLAATLKGCVLFWNLENVFTEAKRSHEEFRMAPHIATDLGPTWREHVTRSFLGEPLDKSSSAGFTETSSNSSEFAITTCIQIFQLVSVHPNCPSRICAPRLAFGLASGTIVVMRLTDFLQTIYWKSFNHQSGCFSNIGNMLKLSRFRLEGHVGPITSLLHPASTDELLLHGLDDSVTGMNQFDADHLVSGGADFTVRLWDLDPWRESGVDRFQDRRSRRFSEANDRGVSPPVCLAVFHCHSSPCIALSIGPPASASLDSCSGNSRLTNCICSVGADGSVALINLHEQRQLLVTGSVNKLSASTVVALGWRVPEDLLLIAHSDGCLEVWNITAGCLDRLETAQAARDLFEQAHFIVDTQRGVSSFTSSMSSMTSQTPSVFPGGRSTTTHPPSFCGSVCHPASSGSVYYAAPLRIRRMPHSRRNRSRRPHQLSTLQLQAIGSTKASCSGSTSPLSVFDHGPAALVFLWDLESLIVDILAQSDKATAGTDASVDSTSIDVICSTQFSLVQLLLSIIHPWELDRTTDHILRTCCALVRNTDQEHGDLPVIDDMVCLGFLSKHGCLSVSMPGWPTVRSRSFHGELVSSASLRLYSLCGAISTNLILSELSLAETVARLNPDYQTQLFTHISHHSHLPRFELMAPDNLRTNWSMLAGRVCGQLLKSMLCQDTGVGAMLICCPELEFLARKWQDRSLPVRYAARSLLLALLDHIGSTARTHLAHHWSSLLPSFSGHHVPIQMTSPPSRTTKAPMNLNQSLPGVQTLPVNGPSRKSDGIGTQKVPQKTVVQSVNRRSSADPVNSSQDTPFSISSDGTVAPSKSASMCNVDSFGMHPTMSTGANHWWTALAGYRVSAREHARLQAVAIVLLGAIGCRFGSGVKRKHPSVAAQDLVEGADLFEPSQLTEANSMALDHTPPLASLTLTPESPTKVGHNLAPEPSHCSPGDEVINDLNSLNSVQEGFGSSSYRLAYSTSHCLTSLLFNRAPIVSDQKLVEKVRLENSASTTLNSSTERDYAVLVTHANSLVSLPTSNPCSSVRRSAIDLLGRGFVVWEPFVDLTQTINSLLLLSADVENLLTGLSVWHPLPSRVDLARTAKESLWQIAFARPQAVVLALSLEVRRLGAQLIPLTNTSTPSASSTLAASKSSITLPTTNGGVVLRHFARRDSISALPSSPMNKRSMMVMMASPAVAAPVFAPPTVPSKPVVNSPGPYDSTACTSLVAARDEILRLFEQLCAKRGPDMIPILPEVVEVVLACLDRTRLKERGFISVFPAMQRFSAFSAHTRLQKACVGGVNGSLTFFDFKVGRYLVTHAHTSPVTAVQFHVDGRLVASYSADEGTLRIWQLHTAGLFGMGSQQVKAVSNHQVPPLRLPSNIPSEQHSATDSTNISGGNYMSSSEPAIWIDWSDSRVVQIVAQSGIRRHINL